MAARPEEREGSPSTLVWMAGLVAIAAAVALALKLLGVSLVDSEQQQPLVWQLADGHLGQAMQGGRVAVPQTSGPGFGIFAVGPYLLVRLFSSREDGFLVVSYLCLVPLGVAAIAASRAVGVAARSGRELLNVAAVLLGIPVLACYTEYFHPADVLATAAVLGAFALIARSRVYAAFALLGFAVITRQWAVVAVAVLAVLLPPGQRIRPVFVAGATAELLVLPFLLTNPTLTGRALAAGGVAVGQLTAPAILPGDGMVRYALSRVLPLLLAALWCAWLWRRSARFHPELAAGALAFAFLLRPMVDPAGYLYYLAPAYAFAVLLRPASWRWPVAGLVGGAVLWYRFTLRARWPVWVGLPNGRDTLVGGSALAVATTALLLVALVAIGRRTAHLLDADVAPAGPAGAAGDAARPGSAAEAAAGRPGDAQATDGVFG